MANAQIGGSQFIGEETPYIMPCSMKLDVLDREGIDGHEFYEVGKRGVPTQWKTFADTNSPSTLIAAYQALDGTTATITNVDGTTVANVGVWLIGAPTVQKMAKTIGGLTAGAWGVTAMWKLQAGT